MVVVSELRSGAEVLRLVHGQGPSNQMKAALQARGNNPMEMLRITSTGEPGSILMAGHRIMAATLNARTSDLAAWGIGLCSTGGVGGDILHWMDAG